MSRQQDRSAARRAKKNQNLAAAGHSPVPTMDVPILGQQHGPKEFAKSVDEIELLGDLLIIREHRQDKSEGGILLPEGSQQEGPRRGEVMAVGPGQMREDGTFMPMSCKKGDLVYLVFGRNAISMNIGGEPYHMIPDGQVMMKVRKPEDPAATGTSPIATEG